MESLRIRMDGGGKAKALFLGTRMARTAVWSPNGRSCLPQVSHRATKLVLDQARTAYYAIASMCRTANKTVYYWLVATRAYRDKLWPVKPPQIRGITGTPEVTALLLVHETVCNQLELHAR